MLKIPTDDAQNQCFGLCRTAQQILLAFWCVALSAASLSATEVTASTLGAGNEAVFISGLQPDRRPEGAPVITIFQKKDDWYQQALRGVEKPYPDTLRFLENQEGWYVPFNNRGMTYRYDIRNLHK